MSATFSHFQQLPAELRIKIWIYAIEPRTVSVITPYFWSTGLCSEKKPVHAKLPTLLHVCQESRSLLLPLYGSIYHSGDQDWEWNGGEMYRDLRGALRIFKIRLPVGPKPKCLLKEALEKYLNDPDGKKTVSKFVQMNTVENFPVWFSVTHDTMLFRLDTRSRMYPEYCLWGPWTTSEACFLQNVAMDFPRHFMHRAISSSRFAPLGQTAWLATPLGTNTWRAEMDPPMTGTSRVVSMDLLIRDLNEVVRVSFDQKALLEPGKWVFRLNSSSEIYKEEMGPDFTNVTWEVLLAKRDNESFWDIISKWSPDLISWQLQKHEICKDDSFDDWRKAQLPDSYYRQMPTGGWPAAALSEVPIPLDSVTGYYLGP